MSEYDPTRPPVDEPQPGARDASGAEDAFVPEDLPGPEALPRLAADLRRLTRRDVDVPRRVDERMVIEAEKRLGDVRPPLPFPTTWRFGSAIAAVLALAVGAGVWLSIASQEREPGLGDVAMRHEASPGAGAAPSDGVKRSAGPGADGDAAIKADAGEARGGRATEGVADAAIAGPTARNDIDRDGRVDIRDAFTLARMLDDDKQKAKRDEFDVNGDGVVDENDVDHIAHTIVDLSGGQG